MEPSALRAGRPASVGQQHEGEQTGDLAVPRDQPVEHPREPDGLRGEVGAVQRRAGARRVALVEDEVEHVQDDAESLGPLGLRRQVEPEAASS